MHICPVKWTAASCIASDKATIIQWWLCLYLIVAKI